MNDLSWLIYLGGVAGKISAVGGGLAFVFFGVAGLGSLYPWIEGEDSEVAKKARRLFVPAIALAIVLPFVPGRDTVLAIAAYEMGEEVLKTPTASKATAALNAWLDRQLAAPAKVAE